MTEREALAVVQAVGAGAEDAILWSPMERIEALATLTLANRVHMQQLKDRLDDVEHRVLSQ